MVSTSYPGVVGCIYSCAGLRGRSARPVVSGVSRYQKHYFQCHLADRPCGR
ncbi:hypothetical protein JB92DRAFT_130591 [Gautieria morchelliformis]|nr:hypothetical protein JB92DRAFT_130591 [Gautieria morchelliformis]